MVSANGFPSVEGRLVCGSVLNVLTHESKYSVKSVPFPRAQSLLRKFDVLLRNKRSPRPRGHGFQRNALTETL